MSVKLVEIKNYDEAMQGYAIQKNLWPDCADFSHFKFALDENNPYYKYYFIKAGKDNAGIIGTYLEKASADCIWLGWYGILPEFRSKGYGKSALLQIIDICKEYKVFKNFRAYTSNYDSIAFGVYESVMDLKEDYVNKDDKVDYEVYIYTKSLSKEKALPWSNKYIGINEYDKIASDMEDQLANLKLK